MTKKKVQPLIIQAAKVQTGHPLKNLLLIYLADFWSVKNGAFPSQTTLAERCGCHRVTVHSALKEMEAEGWIFSKQKHGTNGAMLSKEYTINPAKLGVTIDNTPCSDTLHPLLPETTTRVVNGNTISLVKSPMKSLIKIDTWPDGWCDFDEFYKAYPKKAGKQAARKAWDKINPSDKLLDTIMEDIKNRVEKGAWDTGKGKQYIPNPATYLNGNRWEDDIIPGSDFKPKTDYSAIARDFTEI